MRGNREYRQLTRRCRLTAGSLPLPDPFDVQQFVQLLATARGRPITVLPVPSRPHGPCGLLAVTDEVDYILYTTDTSPMHQQHILLHEIAHLLCEHHKTPAGAEGGSPEGDLFSRLPADLVRRVLGRSAYSQPQEQEAELLASLIQCRIQQEAARPPAPSVRHSALGTLLGSALETGRRGVRRRG